MLDSKLIPTPLVVASERPPVVIVEIGERVRARGVWIFGQLLGWMAQEVWLRVTRRHTAELGARRLRELFERLGFLWIKLGQVLSLRSDILSPELCDQLSQLQYQASGFPSELSRQTVEEELGRPLEQVFSSWADLPFAAASIAQVHRARLRQGNVPVAVKVQRPDAQWIFRTDMALLRRGVAMFKRFSILPHLRWEEFVWELEQIILEEVDYRYEAANLRRMRKSLRRHKVYAPEVFDHVSGRRVLVMEFVEGALMSDYLEVARKEPERLTAWRRDNDIDPARVGNRLFETFFRQLLEDNLFHGDLHPGNIVLLRHSKLALIDFGSVGTMEAEFLARYLLSFEAIATRQYAKAADLTLLLCPELPRVDLVQTKEKIVRAYRSWEMRTNLRNLPYHEKSIGNVGMEVAKIMYDAGAATSWSFMKISRTWGALDASLNFLIPDVNYRRLFQRYFRRATKRKLAEKNMVQRLAEQIQLLTGKIAEYSLLLGPMVREKVMTFEEPLAKPVFVMGQLFRLARQALLAVLVFVGVAFLRQHLPWVDHLVPAVARRWLDRVPAMPVELGVVVLLVGGFVVRLAGRLERYLLRQPVPAVTGG
jgi:ubiquinone biosynthesis protein